MEKFTNPKRVLAPVGGIGIPLQYRSTTNEQFLPLLLISFFTLLAGSAQAQYTFSSAGTIGNLAVHDAGNRSTPVLVDLNGDGKWDIVSGNDAGNFVYYQNIGTAKYSPPTPGTPVWSSAVTNPLAGLNVGGFSTPTFADIDGDGDQDLFSGDNLGRFHYFRNDGGVFTEQFGFSNPLEEDELSILYDVGNNSTIGFLDTDGDGDLDAVAGNSNGEFRHFENEGDENSPYFPRFTDANGILPGNPAFINVNNQPVPRILTGILTGGDLSASVAVVDMDCDGIFAFVSGTRSGGFQYRQVNQATELFTDSPNPFGLTDISAAPSEFSFPSFGDIDGDGDQDAISGKIDGKFVYYQNTTCNTPPTFSFGLPPGCGGTYPVTLGSNGTYTILPADIGNPSANDNGCYSAVVDYSLSSVDCDDVDGLIPIVITARNTVTGVKSTSSCIINVDVNDNSLPVLPMANMGTCDPTQPYYVNLDANGMATMGTVNPNNVPNNFTDNCPMTFTVLNQPPPVFQFNCASITAPPFPTPPNNTPYQIVLQATDNSGNTATCIANVIIRDVTPPAVTPATLPTVQMAICSTFNVATFAIPAFTVTDNCSSTVTASVSVSPAPASTTGTYPNITYTFNAAGTYTVTYTFTDNATPANVTTRTQTIIITNEPLFFNPGCPPNISVAADPVTCKWNSTLAWTPPVGLDCTTGTSAGVTTFGTRNPGYAFPIGTETVVYTANKGANSIQCYFTVTVADSTAPSAVVWTPGSILDQMLVSPANVCGAVATWTEPTFTATENCSGPVKRMVSYVHNTLGTLVGYGPGSTFPVDTTTVTYTLCDQVGNCSPTTLSFIIVVKDFQFPSITCPSPITTVASQGVCYADVFLPKPSGNQIGDNCPLPLNAVTGPTYGGQVNVSGDFWRFPIGNNNLVNFTITDASGNMNICTLTVKVLDTQKPVFSGCVTSDVNLIATPMSCTASLAMTHPTVTDNSETCVPSGTLTYTLVISGATTLPSTSVFPVMQVFNEGESTVLYTATDASGNSQTCSYKVKVTNSVPPSFTNCPSFQGSIGNLPTDASQCYYTLLSNSFAAQLGADGGGVGCDPGTFAFTRLPNTPLPLGSHLDVGVHILKVVATDYSGNTASCQFSVTIQDLVVPNTASTICGSTLNFTTDLNQCSTIPVWNAPVFTDNCGVVSLTATYVNPPSMTPVNYVSGSSLSKGTYILTYTARDAANNPGFCTFTVNVKDTQKPAFTNCPVGTQFVNVGAPAPCMGTFTLTLNATDNCAGTVNISSTAFVSIAVDLDPTSMTPSSTTVTYTATDASLNTQTCAITVQARDVSGPVVTGCPSNTTLTIGSPLVCTLPHPTGWADPNFAAFADCTLPVSLVSGPVAVSQNLTPITITGTSANRNAQFPTGVNTITYTYKDAVIPANTSTCTFTVTVIEGVPPVFVTCPSPITVSTDGNTCARNITTAYLLSLPAAQRPSATDMCSPSIAYTSTLPGSGILVQPISDITISWTATDNSGNSTTTGCVQVIKVRDLTPPTLICGAPYTITALPNNSCVENNNSTYPSIVNPAFNPALPAPSDNCSSPSPVITRIPGQPGQYCVGTHQLSWLVTDGNANTASCSQQITVLPSNICIATTPSFSGGSNCGSVTPFVLSNANCPASVTVTAAQLGVSATDNCNNALTIPDQAFNVSVTGNTIVTFTATVGLNTANCTRTVSVTCNPVGPCTPNAVPTMAGCGGTINVNANANCQGVVASFGVTASDNCASRTVTASNSGPFNLGSTIVTFTATNTVGSNSCTKTVVVADVTNPTFVSCPSDITIAAEAGEEFAFSASLDVPSATDNCSVSSIELAVGTPEMLSGDGNVVSWEATDGSGNVAECLQNVTVTTFIGGGGGCSDFLSMELASDGAGGDLYGSSVDVDGSRAVVGAPFDDNGKGINSGAAYILEKNGLGEWVEVAKLIATDGAANDQFGISVAIEGGQVIVGSWKNSGKGAAYVFSGSGATWTQVKKLVASDGAASDDFGGSVDISATHAIVGALNDDSPQVNRGSVYIFGKDQGGANNWGQLVKQVASDGNTNDNYGVSVSIDGNFAVVGARYDDDLGTNSGMAFVLAKDQGGVNNWGQTQKLIPSTGAAGDYYGSSVGISGNQIIVGAYLNDEQGNNAGSAYVFEYNGVVWPEEVKLTASDAVMADQFGVSVSIESGVAVVGAHFDDDMGTNSGSAYVFTQSGGWSEEKLTVNTVSTNDNFGYSVAIGGSSIVIGAYKDDISGLDQGSVYFFGCSNTPLRPQAKERSEVTSVGGQVRCFPNPSTDMVNIDITLEEEENVQVIVSDITGKVISTLFDNKMSGENRLQWEGKQFGNGMYFIRVQSASLREVVPVVIVR